MRQGIIPPHMLRAIAQNGTARQQTLAWATLADTEQQRGQRIVLASLGALVVFPTGARRRSIFDAAGSYQLPGRLVRSESDKRTRDVTVNEAFDYSGDVYDFFAKVFNRNSLDNRGMRLDSTVHYGADYDNAFWNGKQMVYGDGDGQIFGRFTQCLDVIGHEPA